MTTKEIDKFAYDFIIKHKGTPAFLNYMGFPATCCISVNEEVIHGIPSDRKIVSGDIVSLDIGINLKGYYSDAARTLLVGSDVPKNVQKLVSVTKECLLIGIEGASKKGGRIHDISGPISKHAEQNGFSVVRDYCGHGVGLEVHEDPQIPNYISTFSPNPRLREGMVLAIEPMINLGTKKVEVLENDWTVVTADGKPSAHWEHTIAITNEGVQILTLAD
jgi:methionyl aminopeptidase